ncbi:MAG: hypothetical protein EOM90_09330 [Alphaproteobacteria bacterium]|nr:hypothetical protein [Alphaproteobacteria bacterium]
MPVNRNNIHDTVFLASAAAIAFFLPVYGRVVPLLITLMVLNWITDIRSIRNFKLLFREKTRLQILCFGALYLLYLVGMTYSVNQEYGWFDMEIKLSLIVFPLVFSTSVQPLFPENRIRLIFQSFVAGCITGTVILLVHAAIGALGYRIKGYHIPGSFYYMKLAWYFHASYLSMYYNVAISYLIWILLTHQAGNGRVKILSWGALLFLTAMVFLLASKAGQAGLVLTIIFFTGFGALRMRRPGLSVSLVIMGAAAFFLASVLAPGSFSRFSGTRKVLNQNEETGKRLKPESNADRLAVWKAGTKIVKQNLLFGVGTGDVKDKLMEGYRNDHLIPALKHRFNAHNQFLQTFIALGLPGFLLLAGMIIIPAFMAYRRKADFYLLFLILIGINFLFESMLEIQAGVVFYAFMNLVLFSGTAEKK